MNVKSNAKLVQKAGKLYTLGLTVENYRRKLRRLVEKKIPYDSPQMITALEEFQAADSEWKRLEQKYLNETSNILTDE